MLKFLSCAQFSNIFQFPNSNMIAGLSVTAADKSDSSFRRAWVSMVTYLHFLNRHPPIHCGSVRHAASMKVAVVVGTVLVSACAAIPVQDTTLRNADGNWVTCKQVGRGVASYWVGKAVYDDCIAKAQAQGYTLSPGVLPQAIPASGTAPQMSAAPAAPATANAAQGQNQQVTAIQGVTAAQGSTAQFNSPMILTASFPLADRQLWRSAEWTDPNALSAFRDFRCDGIAIAEMQMRGKLQDDGKLKIDIKGRFDTLPGNDKLVDMKVELLNGDTLVGVGYASKLGAPEGKQKKFGFSFYTQYSDLQPTTHLRITFTDFDD
jgi:hypothetical protein